MHFHFFLTNNYITSKIGYQEGQPDANSIGVIASDQTEDG